MVPQFKRTRTTLSPPPLELDLPEDSPHIEIAIEQPSAPPPQVEELPPSSPRAPEEPEAEQVEIIDVIEPTEVSTEPAAEPIQRAPSQKKRKGRRRRKSMKQRAERATEPEEGVPEVPVALEADGGMVPEAQPTLTLKIPAQAPVVTPFLEVVDPNEPRYCFCNQVSYGDVRPLVLDTSTAHD